MTSDQMKDDLAYVANTLRHNARRSGTPLIYVLWAVAIAVGFAMVDFAPHYVGVYWMIVAPVGGALSAWIGMRHRRSQGVRDPDEGRRWGMHFLIGALGWIGAALPLATGRIAPSDGNTAFLLVTGLVYAFAGLHIDRGLLASGLIALAGYVVMQFVTVPYAWTTTGLVMAAALLVAAYVSAQPKTRG